MKENGYMTLVHPGGWRSIDGVFKETQNLIKSKILYLKMHSFKKGLTVFGAKTDYDFYLLKNCENKGKSKIVCEDGVELEYDLKGVEFIPGENIINIYSLIAGKNDEKVKLIHSYSAYEPRKDFMSKEQSDKNIHPAVYMVSYINVPTFLWSQRNDRGHFGVKKVIWASGSSGVILDANGEYGLTPFSAAIEDEEKNLKNIKKALENPDFIRNIMLFKDGLGHKYNNKIISLLKKDFWKEFI